MQVKEGRILFGHTLREFVRGMPLCCVYLS